MMGTQNTVIHGPASRKPLSGTNKPTILIHCEKRKKERKGKTFQEERSRPQKEIA